MGLSEQERLYRMYGAINGFNDLKKDLISLLKREKTYFKLDDLIRYLEDLWHAFLGARSNCLHWFTGSESDNLIGENPSSPWEIAVLSFLEPVARTVGRFKDSYFEFPESDKFNAIDSTGISDLLGYVTNGKVLSAIYKIYQYTEHLSYPLKRYNDEFRESFKEVDSLISKIQGECYNIFVDNDNYAKAYLLHEIVKKLYCSDYPYRPEKYDIVTKLMVDHNFHHHISKMMKQKLSDIASLHIKLVDDNSLLAKLYVVLSFDDIYNFSHIKNPCLHNIKNSKSFSKQELKDIEKLVASKQKEFDNNKKKEDTEKAADPWPGRDRELACYGFYASDLKKPDNAKKLKPRKTKHVRR